MSYWTAPDDRPGLKDWFGTWTGVSSYPGRDRSSYRGFWASNASSTEHPHDDEAGADAMAVEINSALAVENIQEQDSTSKSKIAHVAHRAVVPVLTLMIGLSIATAVRNSFSLQGRMRAPIAPLSGMQEVKYKYSNLSRIDTQHLEEAVYINIPPGPGYTGNVDLSNMGSELPGLLAAYRSHTAGKTWQTFNLAFPVPENSICPMGGYDGLPDLRCANPGICCPGVKGMQCGEPAGTCAMGFKGSLICSPGATPCINNDGAAYCCAPGNTCGNNLCFAGPGQCFPGEAVVEVKGLGAIPMKHLKSGDEVLGKSGAFEPVLGFLHVTGKDESSNFLTVKHSHGVLRVSQHHVVFVEGGDKLAIDLSIGDKVLVSEGAGLVPREVVSVVKSSGRSGMFAPLTPSGTVVVDGVAASNYASPSHISFPHSGFHAIFFPVRAFHALGLATFSKDLTADEHLHPFAAAVWRFVGPVATAVL